MIDMMLEYSICELLERAASVHHDGERVNALEHDVAPEGLMFNMSIAGVKRQRCSLVSRLARLRQIHQTTGTLGLVAGLV